MSKEFSIKITSAVVIAGKIQTPDKVISVDEKTAKNLLRRGKCELEGSPQTEEEEISVDDLPNKKVDELKAIADSLGIEDCKNLKKDELIERITELAEEAE